MCDMTQDDIRARLGNIESKLDQVIVSIHGDEMYGSRGLAPRLSALEKRMDRLEGLINRIIWMAAGAGFAGWGVGELIARMFGG